MKVESLLLDGESRDPIEGASVVIIDKDGKTLGPGVVADEEGWFSITSSLLDTSGNKLRISAVGYDTMDLPPASVSANTEMYRSGGFMDEVTVVFRKVKKQVKKGNYTVPIVMGSVAVVIAGFAIYKKVFK